MLMCINTFPCLALWQQRLKFEAHEHPMGFSELQPTTRPTNCTHHFTSSAAGSSAPACGSRAVSRAAGGSNWYSPCRLGLLTAPPMRSDCHMMSHMGPGSYMLPCSASDACFCRNPQHCPQQCCPSFNGVPKQQSL